MPLFSARGSSSPSLPSSRPPYRILISNDDGVRAPGIAAVAQILQAIGQVIIVAPAENQSGKGHSIVTSEPILREDLTLPNGLKAIGLTATPATTVNVAIRNIVMPLPDLVVSGINRGYNLGYTAYLSGTVGAAREAAMHGVPAIAASVQEDGANRNYGNAAEEVLGVARRVKQDGLPRNTFLNVNVPAMPARRLSRLPRHHTSHAAEWRGAIRRDDHILVGPNCLLERVQGRRATASEGTDIHAVNEGYVSVTPMKLGETDPSQFEALRAIFK